MADIVVKLIQRQKHNGRWEDVGTLLRMSDSQGQFLIDNKKAVRWYGKGNVARPAPQVFARRTCCGG